MAVACCLFWHESKHGPGARSRRRYHRHGGDDITRSPPWGVSDLDSLAWILVPTLAGRSGSHFKHKTLLPLRGSPRYHSVTVGCNFGCRKLAGYFYDLDRNNQSEFRLDSMVAVSYSIASGPGGPHGRGLGKVPASSRAAARRKLGERPADLIPGTRCDPGQGICGVARGRATGQPE